MANDDLSKIVDTTASELMKRFEHNLPKGAIIMGTDHTKRGDLELPRRIVVEYEGLAKLPKTKLNGLYRRE
ncbi:MAG: hypothetical protein ABIB47_05495 [Candidatus Woesearchaeota archaeon]